MRRCFAAIGFLALLFACGPKSSDIRAARDSIDAGTLLEHIKILASDEFEGRAPGTRGEELTVNYLIEQFQKIGLKPGNPDGSYVQKVPLAGILSKASGEFVSKGRRIALSPLKDFVGVTRRYSESVEVKDSDVVFVGYGVVAPEYGWDDYKDVDVRGKTIIMLINDPAVHDPHDPTKLDETMFRGRAMTYYGRWTYKYEIATEKGAAAAIIVHETGPAGYPFEVVTGSWGRENFDIVTPDRNMSRVPVEGWISLDKAKEVFKAAGQDFDQLKEAAVRKDFRPVPLGLRANFRIRNTLREVGSRNVIAKLDGSDPTLRDEYIIYTAHWDHLGKDNTLEGDQIFNGAHDNATGTAGLLELAKAFSKLDPRPKRSILFLAVTAEEQGLLGAKYYAANPLYPLERTVANINMDGLNTWGRTSDIVVIGLGNSTLDDVLAEAARAQGRVLKPDAEPEKGFYYRSDHFEFAKLGVPALYTDNGTDYIGKPQEWALKKREEYTKNDYHKPSDEVREDWDLSGAVEDLSILFEVGFRVAQAAQRPEWKEGTEFKAKRDAALKSR
jgi:Zn-dependent M28 family amino/carboxypeptidase